MPRSRMGGNRFIRRGRHSDVADVIGLMAESPQKINSLARQIRSTMKFIEASCQTAFGRG